MYNLRHIAKKIWGRGRVPSWMPNWVRTRIEVNTNHIHDLMQEAQSLIQPHETVLDAGAGEGRFRAYLEHGKYLAVDFGKGDEEWDYTQLDTNADLLKLPFRDGSIDNVVCTQVLEHVRDPQQVIQEFGRVLRPGGRLFVSVPQSWHQHQKPHDYFRFTSFALDMLFTNAGLKPIYIRPMGGYFWFLSYQLQMMHYWLGMAPRRGIGGLIKGLIILLLRIFFLFIVPIPLYYLDRFDPVKDLTMGYTCYCIKQESK